MLSLLIKSTSTFFVGLFAVYHFFFFPFSSVHFLVTADAQFGKKDKGSLHPVADVIKWNNTSRMTLQAMANKKIHDSNIRGIIVAGDLTHNSLPYDQYDLYKSALNPVGKDNVNGLAFTYDGFGNHDMAKPVAKANDVLCDEHSSQCVSSAIIRHDLATRKRDTLPLMRQGAHYAWKWGDVTFAHLNLFPADTLGPHKDLSPENSLMFLRAVIRQMDKKKDRLVVIHHYTFNEFSKGDPEALDPRDWWSTEQMEEYWNSLSLANVIAIFTGHSHRQPTTSPVNDFIRPEGSTKGPELIPAFVAGSAGMGLYLDVKISHSMLKVRPVQVFSATEEKMGKVIKIPLS